MKTIVSKFGKLVEDITSQKGPFTLFVLTLPDDTFAWDVLVAAEWVDENQSKALSFLTKAIQSTLTEKELLTISGVILLDNESFSDASASLKSELGYEAVDLELFGRHIQKAYIFVTPEVEFRAGPTALLR
jgi:hypothetical protein